MPPNEMHAIAAVIDLAAAAVVAARAAVLAAVGDMQLAAAMAAPQQAGEQRLAAADRAAAHEALAVGVVADQALVPLELRPANVTLVVVADQNLPGAAILAEAAHDPLAAGLDRDAAAGAPEGIGAGVDRVRQHVMEGVVDRQLPDHLAAFRTIFDRRQGQALLAHPEVDLADRLQLGELGEDERDRLLDAPIRDPSRCDRARSSDSRSPTVRKSSPRRAFCFRASSERWRNSDSSISLIVPFMPSSRRSFGMPRIVDAVLVDDQRADQAAELQQRVPVAPVAGEPRRLDRDDGADPTLADRGQQLLEAGPGDAGAGAAEIIVDDLHGGPAQRAGAIGQGRTAGAGSRGCGEPDRPSTGGRRRRRCGRGAQA